MLGKILKLLGGFIPTKPVDAALGFLRGKKTYTAGAALLLQALTMALSDLETINSVNELIDFAQAAPSAPWFASFAEGLGLIGLRAAKDK